VWIRGSWVATPKDGRPRGGGVGRPNGGGVEVLQH